MHVLVTGATGYLGGRLIPRLLEAGHAVRALVRDQEPVEGRPWVQRAELVRGDLLKPDTLLPVLRDLDAAYYLVHSMHGGADFEQTDRDAATNFAHAVLAAGDAGPGHVIYLGGLQPDPPVKSRHLASRAEVGRLLADLLPGRVTEFRAGPIIGSGSASFEMVRTLAERLPVMLAPRWIETVVTPVAVRDVLAYLIAALDAGPGGVMDIGDGPLSFEDMLREVARQRGNKRYIIKTSLIPLWVAKRWVSTVTPIPLPLAKPLVEGMTQDLRADTAVAQQRFPAIEPLPYPQAVHLALRRTELGEVETRWSGSQVGKIGTEYSHREGMALDQRTLATPVPPEYVFRAVCSVGGDTGWLSQMWAWRLRGVVDKLLGGPGLRRGRRTHTELFEGEAVDWWRVERLVWPDEHGRTGVLRLRAEMRVPGAAWLQWEVAHRRGWTRLIQTAMFEPRGLPGTLYWYAMLPMHGLIFPGMLRRLEQRASELWNHAGQPPTTGQTDPS